MVHKIGSRPSLTDLAYEALVEAIYDRTYAPGDPVSIDELATRLGISATPVREALVRAASQRLLTRVSNKGFRVADLLTPDDYHKLYETRRLLEVHAAAHARLSTEGVARLAGALEQMRTASSAGSGSGYADVAGFSRADQAFHDALVEMADNEFVLAAWRNLHAFMHVQRLYAGSGVFDAGEAIAEHEAILVAARAADRDALAEAVARHIDTAEGRLAMLLPDARAAVAG
jgi:DNA-binding GntR family transcriptional regulator